MNGVAMIYIQLVSEPSIMFGDKKDIHDDKRM